MRPHLAYAGLLAALSAALATAEEPGEQFKRPLGFPLVATTVVEVQDHLGPAPITRTGHYENVVCYIWPKHAALVTFMSQGEGLSGRFTMRTLGEPAPPECRHLDSSVVKGQKLEVGGLRLGMSRGAFEALLGKLAPLPGGMLGVTFDRTEPIDRKAHPLGIGDTLYISIVVGGKFQHDHLVELDIWKTIST
jgi:hypothetical protein